MSDEVDEMTRLKADESRREEVLRMLDRRFALVDCAHPAMNLLRREAERHWLDALEDSDE